MILVLFWAHHKPGQSRTDINFHERANHTHFLVSNNFYLYKASQQAGQIVPGTLHIRAILFFLHRLKCNEIAFYIKYTILSGTGKSLSKQLKRHL
jgi:hypothetical protein